MASRVPRPNKSTPVLEVDGISLGQSWFDFLGYIDGQIQSIVPAWTPYTPTITSSGGTLTTVTAAGSYLAIGKLVHFTVTITVTNIGTGSGAFRLPLPIGTAKRSVMSPGVETAGIGIAVTYAVAASANFGSIQAYNNSTTLIVNGYVITITGMYEQT